MPGGAQALGAVLLPQREMRSREPRGQIQDWDVGDRAVVAPLGGSSETTSETPR
jgi:hypothetical protein